MSHTPEDLAFDYMWEQSWVEEEQAERDREVVESFTQERLKAYYVAHPDVAQKPMGALAKAKSLRAAKEPQAALVMAAVAIEVGYKAVLLRPVVSSLVHNEAMAEMVMELATSYLGLDRFSGILQAILVEFAGVDLQTFVRKGGKENLWAEMKKVAQQRNAIVHGGADADLAATRVAIAVADTLLNVLLPKVFAKTSRYDTPWVGNLMVAVGGIGLIVITLLTNYASRFGFLDEAGKFTPFFPNDQFAYFILSATVGSFAIELVYLVLAVAAFRLVAQGGNKPWQYLIVAAAVATPILGFYGALAPAPHDRSNYNWEAAYWTIGLLVVAVVWFAIVVTTRRSSVDNAAAHAAEHHGVPPLDETLGFHPVE